MAIKISENVERFLEFGKQYSKFWDASDAWTKSGGTFTDTERRLICMAYMEVSKTDIFYIPKLHDRMVALFGEFIPHCWRHNEEGYQAWLSKLIQFEDGSWGLPDIEDMQEGGSIEEHVKKRLGLI